MKLRKYFVLMIMILSILITFTYGINNHVSANNKFINSFPKCLRGSWNNKQLKLNISKNTITTYIHGHNIDTEVLKKYYKHSRTNYSDKQLQRAKFWLYATKNKATGNKGIILNSWFAGTKPTLFKLKGNNKIENTILMPGSKPFYLFRK